MPKKSNSQRVLARNRKASRDYQLDDRFEAGLALRGSEVKAARAGQVSLNEAYVAVENGEAWLHNAHVAAYQPASRANHDPRRRRKLLLHRRELDEIAAKVKQRGWTVIPTRLYLRSGRIKLEIALARGKRQYDKRREMSKREAEREMARAAARRGPR